MSDSGCVGLTKRGSECALSFGVAVGLVSAGVLPCLADDDEDEAGGRPPTRSDGGPMSVSAPSGMASCVDGMMESAHWEEGFQQRRDGHGRRGERGGENESEWECESDGASGSGSGTERNNRRWYDNKKLGR